MSNKAKILFVAIIAVLASLFLLAGNAFGNDTIEAEYRVSCFIPGYGFKFWDAYESNYYEWTRLNKKKENTPDQEVVFYDMTGKRHSYGSETACHIRKLN